MKKAAIAFVALPLLCLGAGYGAGLTLAPAKGEDHAALDAKTAKGKEGADSKEAADKAKDPAKKGEVADKDGKKDTLEQATVEDGYAPMDPYAIAQDRKVVRLGQMTIPVEKTHSVSYVVADFALKLESLELAERYRRLEEGTRLRDSLLQAMTLAAESAVLRGVAIDSDALSQLLRDLISKEHEGVDDVLFVSLYKQDVARL